MKTINPIKQYKQKKGLTYGQLADMTGLHPMLIYQHCSGQKRISTKSAVKYHEKLKISYRKLLELEE